MSLTSYWKYQKFHLKNSIDNFIRMNPLGKPFRKREVIIRGSIRDKNRKEMTLEESIAWLEELEKLAKNGRKSY